MASAWRTMNFEALLAPVSDALPSGEDMSFSTEFDVIAELRRADDPTLDQGEWVTSLKAANWPGVLAQCEQLLMARSKDLRVAAWWTDASARLHGYAGLADGLTLCRSLSQSFWADLHPQLDEGGDAEQRAGALRWLLTQVEALTSHLSVLQHGARTYSISDMGSAKASTRSTERRDDAAPSGEVITVDDIAAARRNTPREFLVVNLSEAKRAQAALAELQLVIDPLLGAEGPAFTGARRALEDAVHAVERLAREADPLGAAAASESGESAGGQSDESGAVTGAFSGTLRTRAEALQQLRAVAAFFRRTEPHSPVAYLADRAAHWGEMPLHAWLRAVMKDAGSLSHIEELLGVEPPASPAD
jgi:type VI secretion system protein ImpA